MAEAADGAAPPSDHVRIKRKKTTIFLYMESDATVHDLRAKVNHITKVPTSDIKFFVDKDGEIVVDENKTLAEQKVRNWPPAHTPREATASESRARTPLSQIQCDDVVYMVYRKEGARAPPLLACHQGASAACGRWPVAARQQCCGAVALTPRPAQEPPPPYPWPDPRAPASLPRVPTPRPALPSLPPPARLMPGTDEWEKIEVDGEGKGDGAPKAEVA